MDKMYYGIIQYGASHSGGNQFIGGSSLVVFIYSAKRI